MDAIDNYYVTINPEASTEIADIISYLIDRLQNRSAARKQTRDFEKAIASLRTHALRCPVVFVLRDGEAARILHVNHYFLLYVVVADNVRILHAFHESQDFRNKLFDHEDTH